MYFYYYFLPLDNDRLNLRTTLIIFLLCNNDSHSRAWGTYGHNCMREIPTDSYCCVMSEVARVYQDLSTAIISLKNSHCGFASQDERKFKTHLQ